MSKGDMFWKKMFFVLAVLMSLYIIMIIYFGVQLKKEELRTEACMSLLVVTTEELSFSINYSNLTVKEFSNLFLKYKFDEMLNETLGEYT